MNDCAIGPATQADREAAERQPDLPSRILVVDDDQAIRQLNTRVLLRSGYKVEAAADGAAAWRALNSGSYDLLLTDHEMPEVSGVELLRKLRAARMALPVIMATGAFPAAEFARNPGLNPSATLLKPYTIEELLETVKRVLHVAPLPAGSFRR